MRTRTIVYVSSALGWLNEPFSRPGLMAYRCSKAAENGLMVSIHDTYVNSQNEVCLKQRMEQYPNEFLHRVVSIHPGYVATGIGKESSNVSQEEMIKSKQERGAMTEDKGVATLLWTVVAKQGVQSGKHYVPGRKEHSF